MIFIKECVIINCFIFKFATEQIIAHDSIQNSIHEDEKEVSAIGHSLLIYVNPKPLVKNR